MSTRGADGGSARPFRRGPRHRARHKRRAARSRWRRPVLLASGLVIIALAAVGAWVAQVHAQRDTVLGGVTVAGHEVVDARARELERVMLGIRMREGLSLIHI